MTINFKRLFGGGFAAILLGIALALAVTVGADAAPAQHTGQCVTAAADTERK